MLHQTEARDYAWCSIGYWSCRLENTFPISIRARDGLVDIKNETCGASKPKIVTFNNFMTPQVLQLSKEYQEIKTRELARRAKVFQNARIFTHFHKKTRKMQLICIKHTPFHKNACILCKLDENARIFCIFMKEVFWSRAIFK